MRFPLVVNGGGWGIGAEAKHLPVHGQANNSGSAPTVYAPVPEACTLDELVVQLQVAPGAGTGIKVDFMVNSAAVAASVTIEGTSTEGKWTGAIAIAKGDRISLRATPIGVPNASSYANTSAITTVLKTTGKTFFIPFIGSPAMSAAEPTYWSLGGWQSGTAVTTKGALRTIAPEAGTLKAIAAVCNTNPGAAKKYTIVLMRNGAAAGPEVTIENTTAIQYAEGSQALSGGDTLEIRATPSGTPTASTIRGMIAIEAEVAGRSWWGGVNTAAGSTTVVNTTYPSGHRSSYGVSGGNTSFFPAGFTLTSFRVEHNAPGSGKKRAWQFGYSESGIKNTELVAAIEGEATTGSDLTHSYLTTGKALILSTTPTGTPAALTGAFWGLVVVTPQTYTVEIADSVELSDGLGKKTVKAPADSVTLADSLGKKVGKSAADTVALVDGLGKAIVKRPADAVSLEDALEALISAPAKPVPLEDLPTGLTLAPAASLQIRAPVELELDTPTTTLELADRGTGPGLKGPAGAEVAGPAASITLRDPDGELELDG